MKDFTPALIAAGLALVPCAAIGLFYVGRKIRQHPTRELTKHHHLHRAPTKFENLLTAILLAIAGMVGIVISLIGGGVTLISWARPDTKLPAYAFAAVGLLVSILCLASAIHQFVKFRK